MTERKDLGFPRLDVSIPELWRQKSWMIISENRRCLSSCWHPVIQKRIREGRGKDLYLRKLASARQTFQYWGIFPTGANMLLRKRTKYSLSLWVPFLPQGTPNLGEFLSFVIHLHIRRIWNVVEPSLPVRITALSYNKAHLYSWSLGFDFCFWTTECNPENWFLNFAPRKEDKPFMGNCMSKWLQTSVRAWQPDPFPCPQGGSLVM